MPSRQYWVDYLKSAKNGHDRPIDGSSSKRVIRGHDGDIILRLHNTDVVTLHEDGTETIRTGGWNTVTTMRFLRDYSRARVWSVKGQWSVEIEEPGITPPRVRKCRRCKGGQVPQECHGPGWCYSSYATLATCEHGITPEFRGQNHRLERCNHGLTERHALPSVDCWQCKGEGVFDYGSNPLHYQWHGESITISEQGYAVGHADPKAFVPAIAPKHKHGGWNNPCDCDHPPVTQQYVPTPKAPKSYDYSESGRMLRAALPGLDEYTDCPEEKCSIGGAMESLIIHLNDIHMWRREQIADWLEGTGVDLSFPVPENIPAHVH